MSLLSWVSIRNNAYLHNVKLHVLSISLSAYHPVHQGSLPPLHPTGLFLFDSYTVSFPKGKMAIKANILQRSDKQFSHDLYECQDQLPKVCEEICLPKISSEVD